MIAEITVIQPLANAWTTTRRLLGEPFSLVKWLGLGFTAWLAALGEVSPVLNLGHQLLPDDLPAAKAWVLANPWLAVALALGGGLLVIVASLVLAWISCRGKFMFLDNVIRGRAEIAEPWQRLRRQGNSYFLFALVFGLAATVALGLIIGLGVLIAMPDIAQGHFGPHALAGAAIGGLLLLLGVLALSVALVCLEDFIIPIMALRSSRVLAAWREFRGLLLARPGAFVLYLLFKFVLSLAAAAAILLLSCCLCCVIWIPYLNAVILLPVSVFLRCFPLHFLEQLGGAYRFFESEPYLEINPAVPT